jgi:hypothetical protein
MKNISILDLKVNDYVSVIDMCVCHEPETIFCGTVRELILWIVEEYTIVEGDNDSATLEDFLDITTEDGQASYMVVTNPILDCNNGQIVRGTEMIPVIP